MTSSPTTKALTQVGIFLAVFCCVQLFRGSDSQAFFANTVFTYQELVCGSDDPEGVTVTQDERTSATNFIDQVKIVSPDFGVTYAVNNKEFDSSKLIPAAIQTSAIWWLLMIFSIFGSLSYSYSACCPNSCPCCHCCRRDFSKGDPHYTRCELLTPSIFAIVFSVIVIITAAIGLSYAPKVASGIKSMRCQFITSLADIVEPYNATNTYPGIFGLKYRLGNISSNLTSFQNQVEATFNVDRPNNMKTTQANTLSVVEGKKTTAQNFASYSTNPQGTSTSVQSYFGSDQKLFYYMVATSQQNFQSSYQTFQPYIPLGEYTTLKSFYDVQVNIMTALNSAVQPFKKSINFGASLQVGIDQADLVTADVDKVSASLYDFTSPMGQYADNITQALYGLYAVALAFSAFITLSILIVLITKKFGFRRLIHIGWCVYSIIMILGFFLGAILNPASVISLQFCDYLTNFIHDEPFFLTSNLIEKGQTKDILQECFYGKGDILKILNITDASSQLRTLVTTISDFQTKSQAILKTGVSNTSQYLDQQTYIIGGLKNGTYGDFKDTTTTGVGPLLASFNSNTGTGCIEIAQKICADNKTIPSQTSTASKCWHPYLLTQTSNYATFMCAGQQSDGTKLYTWFNQQSTIWNQALTDQKDIVDQHNTTQTSFSSYLIDVNGFIKNTVDFVSYNADPDTGIAQAMNCSVIVTYFDKLYDVTCVLFVPQVYRATILIITISVAMFVGSCASACAGIRFFRMSELTEEEKINHKVQPDEKLHIDDETQHLKQPSHREGNQLGINRIDTSHHDDHRPPIQQIEYQPEQSNHQLQDANGYQNQGSNRVASEQRYPTGQNEEPQQESQQEQQQQVNIGNEDELLPLDE